MTLSVINSWQRIDSWLKAHAPQNWQKLNPGVSEQEIRQKEEALGVLLPEDFKASYRLHNGCKNGHFEQSYLLMGWEYFYPLKSIGGGEEGGFYHDLLQDPSWANTPPTFLDDLLRPPARIQPIYRHPRWLTFTRHSGADEEWCLDLAPAPLGQPGQLLRWALDDGPCEVVFSSFETLLSTYADLLEAGVYLGLGSPSRYSLLDAAQLQDRRTAFLRPTPAKPLLLQGMQLAWDGDGEPDEEYLTLFARVLQMEEATPEDRLFAYYGLIIRAVLAGYEVGEERLYFKQWQAETRHLPETHWTRQELASCARYFPN